MKVTGQKVVQPTVTALDQIGEETEAEYIAIEKVKVESVNTYNEYTVTDAVGYTFLVKTTQPLDIGATYDRIEGVVTYSFNAYKLLPTVITEQADVPTTEAPTTEAPVVQHAISGYVFFDQNSNGKYDRPDRKLSDVKVDVYQNGQWVKTVKTDKEGHYKVTVNEGTYILKFAAPDHLVETFADQTSDDLDSDMKDGKVTVKATKDVKDVTAGFAKNIGKFRK